MNSLAREERADGFSEETLLDCGVAVAAKITTAKGKASVLDKEFSYYLADTDAGRDLHFRLRYEVYCLREQFEDHNHFPDKKETDQYDHRSVHFLVQARRTGAWIGAMRLVVGEALTLPLNQITSLDCDVLENFQDKRVAEASRLCAIPHNTLPLAIRGAETGAVKPVDAVIEQRLHVSWIAVGLIRAARQYCLAHGINTCFFLISDPLARILRRMGMEIEPVGNPCDHRGWRRPFCHDFTTGYRLMAHHSPELYRAFCQTTGYRRLSELEPVQIETALAISA